MGGTPLPERQRYILLLLLLIQWAGAQLRQQIRTDECPIVVTNRGLYVLTVYYPRFKSRGAFETERASDWLVLAQNRTYVAVATNPFFRRSIGLAAVLGRSVSCSVPDAGEAVCNTGLLMECDGTTLLGFACRYLNWDQGFCAED